MTDHDGHMLLRLERGRPLTDDEIACYLADQQTALRHGTAHIGDEIAEQLRVRLAAAQPGTSEPALLRKALLRMVNETYEAHHTPSSESGPEEWDYTLDAPSIEAVEQAFRALADADSAPPASERLREALATAICSTFDMDHHDHDAFLQPDQCEQGLRDADALLSFIAATPAQVDPAPELPGVPLDVERLARALGEFGEATSHPDFVPWAEQMIRSYVSAARLSPTPEEQP